MTDNKKKENVIKALMVVNEVEIYGDGNVFDKVSDLFMNKHTVAILEKKWIDRYGFNDKFNKELDLSNIETWRTYTNCRKMFVALSDDGKSVVCKILVYEGSFISDYTPSDGRFLLKFILPDDMVGLFEDVVLSKLTNYLDSCYDDELEKRRLAWIKEEKNKILGA